MSSRRSGNVVIEPVVPLPVAVAAVKLSETKSVSDASPQSPRSLQISGRSPIHSADDSAAA